MLLILLPVVYGERTFFVGEEGELFANCKNNTYITSGAEVAVYYPNSSVFLGGERMLNTSIGRFYFNFTTPATLGSYMACVDCNISEVHGVDCENFWVREAEEEMTSMAVVIFIMIITLGVFFAPIIFKKFSNNYYLDSTLKGACIVFGLLLLSLDATIVVTVADNAKLGINKEIFRYLWMINWGAYIGMVVVVLGFGWKMLQAWKIDDHNRKMGYDEDEQE